MNTLLQPEKNLDEWTPPSSDERHNLSSVERTLAGILTSLETTLPDALVTLRDAKLDGEPLCDPESLAELVVQVEALRAKLVSALDPAYKEIQDLLSPPRGGDGPAWE